MTHRENRARISAIAALGNDRIIAGPEGGLPWHLPGDWKRFRATTMGHPVALARDDEEVFSGGGATISVRPWSAAAGCT